METKYPPAFEIKITC